VQIRIYSIRDMFRSNDNIFLGEKQSKIGAIRVHTKKFPKSCEFARIPTISREFASRIRDYLKIHILLK
jgi:hypothetical protein